MIHAWTTDDGIKIESDHILAEIHPEGYTTGVAGGTFADKATGARDLGSGLDVVDFLLEPIPDEPPVHTYSYSEDDPAHGNIPKRMVEMPQICTQAKKINCELIENGPDRVVVRQSWRWQKATYGRKPGSLWEQTLIFPDGKRYFLSSDKVTSANEVEQLILRIDLPGHINHHEGKEFAQIYLSYRGYLPREMFLKPFPPHGPTWYQRGRHPMPKRMIRAYQVVLDGKPGPWLAGMTLNPADVWEAWCNPRPHYPPGPDTSNHVCMIQEIGCRPVKAGESFGASYVIGWFDDVAEMERVYDAWSGSGSTNL